MPSWYNSLLHRHDLHQKSFVLSHTHWEPCQADHAARPLLYQHYESLVLQHQKKANKAAETEPR